MPVRVPAGGISRMPVTPRSDIVSRQRSQRTGLAIWPTIRVSTSTPSWTTLPSLLEMTGMRASWTETERASVAEVAHGRGHVPGVEGAGDAERHQAGLGWRRGGERLQLLEGAGRDDLARAVVVGGSESVLLERGQDLVAVATQHGGHAGRGDGGRLGHRVAALADQHHRLLGGDDPGAGGGGQLTHAVAGDGGDGLERVGRVGKELQGGHQSGRDQQWLRDLGVTDGVGVRLGAVVDQVDAGDGRRATPCARRRSGPRARGSGSRGSGRPGRARR